MRLTAPLRVRLFLVLVSLAAAGSRQAAAATPPHLSFEDEAIVATGVSSGAKVVWFGVGHAHEEAALHIISRHAMLVDDDGNGEVRFEIQTAVPVHSVWVAVDMETGEYSVAAPEGHELRQLELSAHALHPGAGGGADLFDDAHRMMQVVVARPRSGAAWGADVADGGGNDDDGQGGNGHFRLSLEALMPFDGSPELQPPVLRAGDVFVAIALDSLEMYAARLPVGGRQQ